MQETNEALVQRIQAGETDLLPLLWSQVQAFVRYQAARWARAWKSSRPTLEFDDLFQCGYFALCEAVETFQAGEGSSFTSWMANYLLKEFACETGCRTAKQRKDPIAYALSLDAPLGGETEDFTLGDIVADRDDPFGDTEAEIYHAQLQAVVQDALACLPQRERETLRLRFLEGKTLSAVGQEIGCGMEWTRQLENKGLRKLRHCSATPALRECYYGDRDVYRGTGFRAWRQTGCSIQERELIRKEQMSTDRSQ